MNESPEQIAQEAEGQLEYRNLDFPETHKRNQQIILSAITKATEAKWKWGKDSDLADAWRAVFNYCRELGMEIENNRKTRLQTVLDFILSRAAPASAEQQLSERLEAIWNSRPSGYVPTSMELDFMNEIRFAVQPQKERTGEK